MTVIVKKIGGSMAVVIPKALAREMGLTEGSALDLTGTKDGLLMRRPARRPRRRIADIVADIKPASYRRRSRELAQDRPVGKEPW